MPLGCVLWIDLVWDVFVFGPLGRSPGLFLSSLRTLRLRHAAGYHIPRRFGYGFDCDVNVNVNVIFIDIHIVILNEMGLALHALWAMFLLLLWVVYLRR